MWSRLQLQHCRPLYAEDEDATSFANARGAKGDDRFEEIRKVVMSPASPRDNLNVAQERNAMLIPRTIVSMHRTLW
jgi:hypothetical protein